MKKNDALHPISMTSGFKDKVYKLAQRKEMNMSELVRYLLRREMEREGL